MERNLFADLLSINGIGAITAFNIMHNEVDTLLQLIVEHNYEALSNCQGINNKTALLICNSLDKKYAHFVKNMSPASKQKTELNKDLVFALKKLGYNSEDLKYLNELEINQECEISELISQSIKLIAEKHEQANY